MPNDPSTRRDLRTLCQGLVAVAALGVGGCDDGSGAGRAGPGVPGGKTDCYGLDCEAEAGGPLQEAYCFTEVEGVGTVDTETEYLANVIFCENGQADFEALKAMAIAARSVAYWEMGVNGSICDSQSCQVFSCEGEPSQMHYRAVEETSGQYLYWGDQVTYGFYVRGDAPAAGAGCTLPEGEQWVTYNDGRSGYDVIQTELGWVSDSAEASYGQNRGCMSQLGMICLELDQGFDYLDILRFYYGDDINVAQAQGECIVSLYGDDDDGAGTTGGDEPGTTGDDEPDSGGESGGTGDTTPDGKPRPQDDSDSDSGSGSDSGDPGGTGGTGATSGGFGTDGAGTDGPRGGDTDGGDTEGGEGESGGSEEPDDDSAGSSASDSSSNDDDGFPVPDGDGSDTRGMPGNGTSPWGDGGDTDTDGGSEINTGESGCSVGGTRGSSGSGALWLIGFGLIGWARRRR